VSRLLQRLGPIGMLALLVACHQAPAPEPQAPLFQVTFAPKAIPLPFANGFLAFQLNQLSESGGDFRPIGSARFGPDGSVYMTFPGKDLVARYDAAGDRRFFGPAIRGGGNEPVVDPQELTFVDGLMHLGAKGRNQVLVLDSDGTRHHSFRTRFPGPVCGPGGRCLVSDPHHPDEFFQVDTAGNLLHSFRLPLALKVRPIQRILSDWQVLVWSADGAHLLHLIESGEIRRRFEIDTNQAGAGGRVAALDLDFADGRYWLLFGLTAPDGEKSAYLLVLDPGGFVDSLWQTPFYADGFDLDGQQLLIYQRAAGALMTYLRPSP